GIFPRARCMHLDVWPEQGARGEIEAGLPDHAPWPDQPRRGDRQRRRRRFAQRDTRASYEWTGGAHGRALLLRRRRGTFLMKMLRITGGRIIDPANKRDEVGDVWISDGVFVATPTADSVPTDVEVIEASGL